MMLSCRFHTAVAVAFAGALLAPAASAATVYVKTRYAKVREAADVKSKIVKRVRLGEALKVVSRGKRYHHVKLAGGQTGWISARRVGNKKPRRTTAAGRFLGKLGHSGGGREVSYTAGARGLSQEADQYAQRKGKAASAAEVKKMEEREVSEGELDRFLREGKLGEYVENAP